VIVPPLKNALIRDVSEAVMECCKIELVFESQKVLSRLAKKTVMTSDSGCQLRK